MAFWDFSSFCGVSFRWIDPDVSFPMMHIYFYSQFWISSQHMQCCICLVEIKFNLELDILKTDEFSQWTKDVSYFSIYTYIDCKLSISVFLEYYFLNWTITIYHYQLPVFMFSRHGYVLFDTNFCVIPCEPGEEIKYSILMCWNEKEMLSNSIFCASTQCTYRKCSTLFMLTISSHDADFQ